MGIVKLPGNSAEYITSREDRPKKDVDEATGKAKESGVERFINAYKDKKAKGKSSKDAEPEKKKNQKRGPNWVAAGETVYAPGFGPGGSKRKK